MKKLAPKVKVGNCQTCGSDTKEADLTFDVNSSNIKVSSPQYKTTNIVFNTEKRKKTSSKVTTLF